MKNAIDYLSEIFYRLKATERSSIKVKRKILMRFIVNKGIWEIGKRLSRSSIFRRTLRCLHWTEIFKFKQFCLLKRFSSYSISEVFKAIEGFLGIEDRSNLPESLEDLSTILYIWALKNIIFISHKLFYPSVSDLLKIDNKTTLKSFL